MLGLGFGALWAGYAVASWGYLLVKGYNVSFRAWVSPLHPYTGPWPPEKIPPGWVWPHATGSSSTAGAMLEGAINAQATRDQTLQNEVMGGSPQ